MPLTAAIELSPDNNDPGVLTIQLRIANPTDQRIVVLNPDMGVPSAAARWPYSGEAYQTSLLISFGFLSISVTDEAGKDVSQEPILSAATPALRPPIELAPGDSFAVAIPIGRFYRLEPKKAYRVAIEYGDRNLRVSARTQVTAP